MKNILILILFLPNICFAISEKKIERITKYFIKKFNYPQIIERGTKTFNYVCLIKSIAFIESSYREKSKVYEKNVNDYSYGLMMLRCDTAKSLGLRRECEILLNPWWNIYYGMKYFNKQLKRYDYDIEKAVAAYNAGRVYICRTGITNRGKICEVGKPTNQRYVDRFNKRARNCVIDFETF